DPELNNNSNTYRLLQNYPNPFNPNTVISYQLPVSSKVELTIYNLLGQEIRTLVNTKQSVGVYQV
ncbi:MAG: T9SS type A sorting domain-containing protein, partial [Aliifodinibius sp.]|nr:T9SS type A sorting domain-containing protein [Fodinibius sp.]